MQRRVNPLLILCYHGVSKQAEHLWNPELYMPQQLFRRRMQAIRDSGYQVLPLGLAVQQSTEGALEQPTVAITFDDGWHDLYTHAWPVLQEFQYPATVYQTTFYTNYNRPIFDPAVAYLLWMGKGRILDDSELTGISQPLELNSDISIRKADVLIKARARQLGYRAEQKDDMLMRLASALDIDFARLLRARTLHLMNPSEVAEVSSSGIDIQLHTHSHWMPRDRNRFLSEIERNRFFIEMTTGKPAVHFCYPNGWHRPELGKWLKEANVQTATTCDPGMVTTSPDLMYLPRLTDSCCVSDVRFESWLAGVGLLGASCKRWLGADSSWPSKSPEARAAFAEMPPPEPEEHQLPTGEPAAAKAAAGRG